MIGSPALAQDLKSYVPSTISPEAKALLERYNLARQAHPFPASHSDGDLRAIRASREGPAIASSAAVLKRLGTTTQSLRLGGVDVIEVTPAKHRPRAPLLVYVHGGGFVLYSAKSTLAAPALMADATGGQVISIDYTTAPDGKWQVVTDQVISVYKTLLAQGHASKSIGFFGGSAGAAIIASSVLKMQDQGISPPGGLVLVSPVSDLTDTGDSKMTLAAADPVIDLAVLRQGYDAYAPRVQQQNPYVSPVYGRFGKEFPPVLMQAGTKEVLLSDFVRLNRAIKQAGGSSELDLYEGVIHGFPETMIGTPEEVEAYREAAAFWLRNLRP